MRGKRTFCPEDGSPCCTLAEEPEGFICANRSLCASFEQPPMKETPPMTDEPSAESREHVMPGDPPNICQIALQWYLNFDFGCPHSARESNIAVEGFKDGYRAAMQASAPAVEGREPLVLDLATANRVLGLAGAMSAPTPAEALPEVEQMVERVSRRIAGFKPFDGQSYNELARSIVAEVSATLSREGDGR